MGILTTNDSLTHPIIKSNSRNQRRALPAFCIQLPSYEKHLSEAFAAHKVLTGMVMAVDATAGEKEIIMNHVKATK